MRTSCFVLACLLLCGGRALADDDTAEAMTIKAAELTKLSSAVEAAVHYESDRTASMDEAELLRFASGDDPALLARFAGLQVHVARAGSHADLLVCTGDGTRALLEDAGCTTAMDRHAWQQAASAPCAFTLDLAALCGETVAPPPLPSPLPSPTSPLPPPAAAPAPARATPPLLWVARAVWTDQVDQTSKQPQSLLTRAQPGNRLVLWMQLGGSDAALQRLAVQGKLPIRHKWFRETISGFQAAGVATPTDEIDIPAASHETLARLRSEVRQQGHFTWRTWSAKENPGRGSWRVRVVYADNQPVICAQPSGPQPCEYTIEVR